MLTFVTVLFGLKTFLVVYWWEARHGLNSKLTRSKGLLLDFCGFSVQVECSKEEILSAFCNDEALRRLLSLR